MKFFLMSHPILESSKTTLTFLGPIQSHKDSVLYLKQLLKLIHGIPYICISAEDVSQNLQMLQYLEQGFGIPLIFLIENL